MSKPGGDPSSGISSGDALILPERHPACRRREARPGFRMERENLCFVTPYLGALGGEIPPGDSTTVEILQLLGSVSISPASRPIRQLKQSCLWCQQLTSPLART